MASGTNQAHYTYAKRILDLMKRFLPSREELLNKYYRNQAHYTYAKRILDLMKRRLPSREELLNKYYRSYRMSPERCEAASLSLLERWDDAKYMNLLEMCLGRLSDFELDYWDLANWTTPSTGLRQPYYYNYVRHHRMLLRTLIACCEDSSVIAEAMLKISRVLAVGLLEKMVFACHVRTASLEISQIDRHVHLLDVLSHALREGNLEIMDLRLQLELSNSGDLTNLVWIMFQGIRRHYSWPGDSWVEPKHWPRKKNGLHRESFYSIEFYAAFAHITCFTALKSNYFSEVKPDQGLRQNIVRCFKLLWRAVPTPYLPIEDMQRSVDFRAVRRRHPNREKTDENAFWSETVAELFEDDFPTEFKPRSLKHLSRYAARGRFRSPEQIASLPLPASLKGYLMFET